MPADQLTRPEPLAAAVLDALACSSADDAARRHGVDPGTLADAVDAFTTGGLAALTTVGTARWSQVNIGMTARTSREVAARELDGLGTRGAHRGWWFLNKPPGWRVRLLDADRAAVASALERLRTAREIDSWAWSRYEPETTAFGGGPAMTGVHDLFCADTQGVLRHLAAPSPIGPKEAGVVTVTALTRGARLDAFETGDVFAKVAALRPRLDATKNDDVRRLASTLRPHLLTRPDPSMLGAAAGPYLVPWTTAFYDAGAHLADLSATGRLGRGLRSVLAQIVIFHWNRLDLSAGVQAALAGAAVHALLPGDHP